MKKIKTYALCWEKKNKSTHKRTCTVPMSVVQRSAVWEPHTHYSVERSQMLMRQVHIQCYGWGNWGTEVTDNLKMKDIPCIFIKCCSPTSYRYKCVFIPLGLSFPTSPRLWNPSWGQRLFMQLKCTHTLQHRPSTWPFPLRGVLAGSLHGQPAFQRLADKVVIENVHTDTSTALKKRPNYSAPEYNRKHPTSLPSSLFGAQSRIRTTQSPREKMKTWNRNKTTDYLSYREYDFKFLE